MQTEYIVHIPIDSSEGPDPFASPEQFAAYADAVRERLADTQAHAERAARRQFLESALGELAALHDIAQTLNDTTIVRELGLFLDRGQRELAQLDAIDAVAGTRGTFAAPAPERTLAAKEDVSVNFTSTTQASAPPTPTLHLARPVVEIERDAAALVEQLDTLLAEHGLRDQNGVFDGGQCLRLRAIGARERALDTQAAGADRDEQLPTLVTLHRMLRQHRMQADDWDDTPPFDPQCMLSSDQWLRLAQTIRPLQQHGMHARGWRRTRRW